MISASSWNTQHQYLGCYYLKQNLIAIRHNTDQSEGCRATAKAWLHMQHCSRNSHVECDSNRLISITSNGALIAQI